LGASLPSSSRPPRALAHPRTRPPPPRATPQTSLSPAKDLFVAAAAGPVASLVVVPLVISNLAFGAFYFTMESPSDFINVRDTLLAFTASVTLLIHTKLSGRTRLLSEAMTEVGRGGVRSGGAGRGAGRGRGQG
jgi:hypothetical protein